MLGAGSIEHRELIYYTVSKSTTFEPPRAGPRLLSLRRPWTAPRARRARGGGDRDTRARHAHAHGFMDHGHAKVQSIIPYALHAAFAFRSALHPADRDPLNQSTIKPP